MPRICIVRDIHRTVKEYLLPGVMPKWEGLFRFGLLAYGLRAFTSATGNARMTVGNPNTASSKSRRLLANIKLAEHLGTVFDGLRMIHPGSFVNVDHSDMNGLMVLAAAVQTGLGRAIPCMIEVTYALRLSARSDAPRRIQKLRKAAKEAWRTQSPTDHTIASLQRFADRLGFWPKLVFDRGFGNHRIIEHLAANGATFYIRLKAGRYVEFDDEREQVAKLKETDATVTLFGLRLRIIRSEQDPRVEEPWYILTNDRESSREKIVRIYYHRFEIEETFKDAKHIFGMKRTRLNKPNSLKVVLWFVSIGIALFYVTMKPDQTIQKVHPKKKLSWIRQGYELLQCEGMLLELKFVE